MKATWLSPLNCKFKKVRKVGRPRKVNPDLVVKIKNLRKTHTIVETAGILQLGTKTISRYTEAQHANA